MDKYESEIKMVNRADNIFPKIKGGLEVIENKTDNLHKKYRRAVEIDGFLERGFENVEMKKHYGDNTWRELRLELLDDDKELIDFMRNYFEKRIEQLIEELEEAIKEN